MANWKCARRSEKIHQSTGSTLGRSQIVSRWLLASHQFATRKRKEGNLLPTRKEKVNRRRRKKERARKAPLPPSPLFIHRIAIRLDLFNRRCGAALPFNFLVASSDPHNHSGRNPLSTSFAVFLFYSLDWLDSMLKASFSPLYWLFLSTIKK